jgi:hypothetical protein
MAGHGDEDLRGRRDAAAREMARLRERGSEAPEWAESGDEPREEPEEERDLGRQVDVAGEEQRRARDARDADR